MLSEGFTTDNSATRLLREIRTLSSVRERCFDAYREVDPNRWTAKWGE